METAEDGKFEQIFLYNQCNDWTEHYVNYSVLRLRLHANAGLSPTRLDSIFHRVSTKVKAKRSSLARSDLTAPLQSAEEEDVEGTPIGSSDWLNDLGSELDRVNVFYTTELQVGAGASQRNDGQLISVDSSQSECPLHAALHGNGRQAFRERRPDHRIRGRRGRKKKEVGRAEEARSLPRT